MQRGHLGLKYPVKLQKLRQRKNENRQDQLVVNARLANTRILKATQLGVARVVAQDNNGQQLQGRRLGDIKPIRKISCKTCAVGKSRARFQGTTGYDCTCGYFAQPEAEAAQQRSVVKASTVQQGTSRQPIGSKQGYFHPLTLSVIGKTALKAMPAKMRCRVKSNGQRLLAVYQIYISLASMRVTLEHREISLQHRTSLTMELPCRIHCDQMPRQGEASSACDEERWLLASNRW